MVFSLFAILISDFKISAEFYQSKKKKGSMIEKYFIYLADEHKNLRFSF